MTYCVWARLPGEPGWSCVRTGLTQRDADQHAAELPYPARAMPERSE